MDVGRRPKRRWKRPIARAYCRPRKISSSSLSRCWTAKTDGPMAATRIVRTAMKTTTPTRVKPAVRRRVNPAVRRRVKRRGAGRGRSPVRIVGPVERLLLGVAVDVDDPRDRDLRRILRRVGVLLHDEDPVRGLGGRV